MNKDKNRVAQFVIRIDSSKLNLKTVSSYGFTTDDSRIHSFSFSNIRKLLKKTTCFSPLSLSAYFKHDYLGLCTSSIWSIRSNSNCSLDSVVGIPDNENVFEKGRLMSTNGIR